MLSPHERHLITGILVILMIGAVVKSCRSRVSVTDAPVERLPALEVSPPAD